MAVQAQPLRVAAAEAPESADILTDRQSNAVYMSRVRADVKGYLQTSRKTQETAAKAIGMSGAVVSAFLRGRYHGDALHVAHRLNSWLALETRRGSVLQEPIWVSLEQSEQMWRVLSQTLEIGDLGVIFGAPGLGKTRTATEFKREQGKAVILITATGAVRSPHAFLTELAEEIGVPASGVLQKLFKECVKRLRGSGRLLIIDEAQKLTFRTLDLLRQLRDLARIGICLMGDEVLWKTITTGRTRAEFERLVSRIGIRRAILPGMSRADVTKIASQYLVHADRECIEFLRARAAGLGAIRSIVTGCHAALRLARLEGRSTVGVEDLQRAAIDLGDDHVLYGAMAGSSNGDEE